MLARAVVPKGDAAFFPLESALVFWDAALLVQDIEKLKSITKAEFQAHFERVFFSDETMRLDLQLTSETHTKEQDEYRESNKAHTVFSFLKRVSVSDSIVEFKKQCGMNPDTYKANFATKDYDRQKSDE